MIVTIKVTDTSDVGKPFKDYLGMRFSGMPSRRDPKLVYEMLLIDRM